MLTHSPILFDQNFCLIQIGLGCQACRWVSGECKMLEAPQKCVLAPQGLIDIDSFGICETRNFKFQNSLNFTSLNEPIELFAHLYYPTVVPFFSYLRQMARILQVIDLFSSLQNNTEMYLNLLVMSIAVAKCCALSFRVQERLNYVIIGKYRCL